MAGGAAKEGSMLPAMVGGGVREDAKMSACEWMVCPAGIRIRKELAPRAGMTRWSLGMAWRWFGDVGGVPSIWTPVSSGYSGLVFGLSFKLLPQSLGRGNPTLAHAMSCCMGEEKITVKHLVVVCSSR